MEIMAGAGCKMGLLSWAPAVAHIIDGKDKFSCIFLTMPIL